ncbi:MAG: ABC transporter substrate-binding protein [Bdellovibrionota bacterium]
MKSLLIFALMALAIPSHAAVLEKSKSFVAQLLELGKLSREAKGALTPESKKSIQALSSQVDFQVLAAKSLGATWKKLTPAKRKDFLNTLQETIEVLLYPKADRITSSLNDVKFITTPAKPRQVNAQTTFEVEKQGDIIEKNIEFDLIFDAREKVVDTIIQGEMVSTNLKRQFEQALQKKTFDQLLEQMKKRVADAKSPPKTPQKAGDKK